jgi:hypothetical protein
MYNVFKKFNNIIQFKGGNNARSERPVFFGVRWHGAFKRHFLFPPENARAAKLVVVVLLSTCERERGSGSGKRKFQVPRKWVNGGMISGSRSLLFQPARA